MIDTKKVREGVLNALSAVIDRQNTLFRVSTEVAIEDIQPPYFAGVRHTARYIVDSLPDDLNMHDAAETIALLATVCIDTLVDIELYQNGDDIEAEQAAQENSLKLPCMTELQARQAERYAYFEKLIEMVPQTMSREDQIKSQSWLPPTMDELEVMAR